MGSAMAANYDFANGTAIVQHWSHANGEHRSATAQLRRAFWPGAKDEAANRESHKWLAHVDQDEWPGFVSKAENKAIVECSTNKNANQQSSAIFRPAIAFVAFSRTINHASA